MTENWKTDIKKFSRNLIRDGCLVSLCEKVDEIVGETVKEIIGSQTPSMDVGYEIVVAIIAVVIFLYLKTGGILKRKPIEDVDIRIDLEEIKKILNDLCIRMKVLERLFEEHQSDREYDRNRRQSK